MLACPSSIGLSSQTLRCLKGQLGAWKREIVMWWRRLLTGRQALPAVAQWRCGGT